MRAEIPMPYSRFLHFWDLNANTIKFLWGFFLTGNGHKKEGEREFYIFETTVGSALLLSLVAKYKTLELE